jgi:ribonuclease HI
MKGQVVADFIVQHSIDKQLDLNVSYITFTPWKLHFDGSVCKSGCSVGVIIISPNGAIFEALNRLDRVCTNNQIEYEALLFGLEILNDMGVKYVEAYGDSLLVVQQVSKVCQCLDGVLNAYLDKCLDIIACLDEIVIYHVPRDEIKELMLWHNKRRAMMFRKEIFVKESRRLAKPNHWFWSRRSNRPAQPV